jgi:hypothetical protein
VDAADGKGALGGSARSPSDPPADPESFISPQSQSVIVTSSYLTEAFREVVARDLDRRMLLALCTAGRELRYEELRRRVGNPAPQAFGRAVERLSKHALIMRRLRRLPHQRRFASILTVSSWGTMVGGALDGLAKVGRIPATLPPAVTAQLRAAFDADSATEA